jgi:hypothetical protein
MAEPNGKKVIDAFATPMVEHEQNGQSAVEYLKSIGRP